MTAALTFLLSSLSLVWVGTVIAPQVYRPLMLLVAAIAIVTTRRTSGRAGPWLDTLVLAVAAFGLGWPLVQGDAFIYRAATPTTGDLAAGVCAVLVVLEIARRTTGWVLPVTAVAFLGYAVVGPFLTSIGLGGLAHRGYDLARLTGNLYMTLEGIYGVPLDVAVTYIILFSIYGAVLDRSGAGRFFLNFAMGMSWRARPDVAAGRSVTLAGFLLGTVSGSGVATTVTLGSVAWPVLRGVGVGAETAGAMLAAAGIGALLSPPTLGAAAFLIAEYLRISYLQVLVMATVPTVLYYLSIFLMIGAGSRNPNQPKQPNQPNVFLSYHFLSLFLVAVLMVWGMTPFRAVAWATATAVVLSFLGPAAERLRPRALAGALSAGGADALGVIATTAVAGIIVGVVTLTGLGLKTAGLIVGLAGGSTVGTVVLAAVAVWVLGLAVPVTASYIISAVMVAPALVNVGVAPIAAHMFIFYYAVLSEVSPPTALAPFAAAALTGGRPFRTMVLTWKYVLPAFLVPFAFTLDPRGLGLLLQGPWVDIALGTTTAGLGTAALAVALRGHLRDRGAERLLLAFGGLALVHPAPIADLSGAVLVLVAFLALRRPGDART
jgi:TRAP transporter 4TM/12TM fusion protein